jgi:IclR family pca regulon transcriptional regulator
MESLARGLRVLSLFEQHEELTIAQISKLSGLSRSSVNRCLYTLERLGYVVAVAGGFRLSPAMLPLSAAFLTSNPLASAAQPVVNAIRDELHESSSLAVLDNRNGLERIMYICRAETVRIISVPLSVGSTLPSYCTSIGRVLLAAQEDDALDRFLAQGPFPHRTPKTITDPAALRAEIDRVREQGWSMIDEELERGLRSLAVPVRDRSGHSVAALNVGAQTRSKSAQALIEIALPQLLAGAAHLARLG